MPLHNFSNFPWSKKPKPGWHWSFDLSELGFICQVYDSNNINKIPKRHFIKDGSKIMEKTIDFEHNTNGNKACFNASQKIKHYQIDPKKNKDPFKKAQVNPSI